MSIAKDFTSTCDPQTNDQTYRCNRKVLEMLRCYVRDHQRKWYKYVQVLTYAYNTGVHYSTRARPFELLLSGTPSDPAIYHYIEKFRKKPCEGKKESVMKMDSTVARAKLELRKAQVDYKPNFYWILRRGNAKIKVGDYNWMDVLDGKAKEKLSGHTDGPFFVLDRTTCTFTIQLGDVAERANSDLVVWARTWTQTRIRATHWRRSMFGVHGRKE